MNDLVRPPFAVRLRALTPARVGLGRTGVSLQTRDVLGFQLAHAQARDAVHARLETGNLAAAIAAVAPATTTIRLHSAAPDRATYLQRPDLGRMLDQRNREVLARIEPAARDLVLVVADGLSALAVERHVPGMLAELLPRLVDWRIAPVCIVEQGRVAIGDEIGLLLQAGLSVILIGDRPGLSSPDSLGAYITWQPQPGRTDAERNCISNIRVEGLGYRDAAGQIMNSLTAARRHQLSGTALAEAARKLRNGLPDGREP
jgi:ethanolamine ammonia-lyase small subunit